MRIRCLPFSEFIDLVSILLHNFVEFFIFLYTFLVISFARYSEYIIFLISFSKFSDVFLAFNCASTIGNLRSICLGVKILSPFPYFAVCLASDTIEEQSLNTLITPCPSR